MADEISVEYGVKQSRSGINLTAKSAILKQTGTTDGNTGPQQFFFQFLGHGPKNVFGLKS